MRSLVLVAAIVSLSGCPGRGRPTLEPEGTVTNTWVGGAPPPPATRESPLPAPPVAMPEDQGTETATDGPTNPPPPPPANAGSRRGWVKGGSWDR